MSNTTKSHKSRKTGSAGKPRQRKPTEAPVSGSSSTALAATTPSPDPTLAPEDATDQPAIPVVDPKTQPWYREPDSKTRKKFDKIMVMTAAGRSDAEIAKKLGTSEGTVRFTRYIGRKNRWCDENDELIDLETELALNIDRKIVRNIDSALDGNMTNWQTHEMTIAAAKGRGVFKNHDVVKQDGQNGMQVVAIQVVMPPLGAADQKPEIGDDQMGGVPAYMEAEVVEPTPLPAMRAEFQWVFDFFKGDEIGIIGSALRDFDSAKDLDVLFPASVDFRALAERLKIPYRGGWDTERGKIHILSLGTVAQVGKVVQLTQCSATVELSDHPQAVLLRDGTMLNRGVHFSK